MVFENYNFASKTPGFEYLQSRGSLSPVLLSSPHSGSFYPDGFLASIGIDQALLKFLDDGPVDLLMADANERYADMVAAVYPRAVVDLNRKPNEFNPSLIDDPGTFEFTLSVKAKVGLGVVPTRILGQSIYPNRLKAVDLHRRIEFAYWPYYRFLESLLRQRRALFGRVLVVDCHTMPNSIARNGARRVDITLGDRFGSTCDRDIIHWAHAFFKVRGLTVSCNAPFAGGRIVEHFGAPESGISALQIEVRRSLFLDEGTLEPHSGIVQLKDIMADFTGSLCRLLGADHVADAA